MRIIVTGNDESAAREFRELLLRGKHSVEVFLIAPDEIVDRLIHVRADAVFLLESSDPERALALTKEILDVLPLRIVIVGPEVEAKAVLRLLGEGVYHYLTQHEAEADLIELLQRLKQQAPVAVNMGRIISVLGAGGGAGATMLAVNVAMQLTLHHPRTALLDLRLQDGAAANLLDLQPANTLVDFCRNINRMDETLFERCLTRHDKGLRVLAAPRSPRDIAQVSGRGIRRAINMARRAFDYVLIDLDGVSRPHEVYGLLQTDVMLVVLRLDFTSVRKARFLLDALDDLEIDQKKVQLIVNQFHRRGELPVRDVEKLLGRRITQFIPDDARRVNAAINGGIPFVLQQPRAPVSKVIQSIAVSVNGHMPQKHAMISGTRG